MLVSIYFINKIESFIIISYDHEFSFLTTHNNKRKLEGKTVLCCKLVGLPRIP